jgi:hypothetical protein
MFGKRGAPPSPPPASLPPPPPPPPRGAPPPRPPPRPMPNLVPLLVLAATLIAIWALTGAGYFWPVWPIGAVALSTVKHRRACFGAHRFVRSSSSTRSSVAS